MALKLFLILLKSVVLETDIDPGGGQVPIGTLPSPVDVAFKIADAQNAKDVLKEASINMISKKLINFLLKIRFI
ncbi:MAG: hypothetical protein CVV58_07290 [Tenericutes bacterium HGW-Tenericutes-3]|nr:MAG: hypothetical protein CVV58_07290 [Tenericutes bacterium HGW-Tenericutes-3]